MICCSNKFPRRLWRRHICVQIAESCLHVFDLYRDLRRTRGVGRGRVEVLIRACLIVSTNRLQLRRDLLWLPRDLWCAAFLAWLVSSRSRCVLCAWKGRTRSFSSLCSACISSVQTTQLSGSSCRSIRSSRLITRPHTLSLSIVAPAVLHHSRRKNQIEATAIHHFPHVAMSPSTHTLKEKANVAALSQL